MLAPNIVVEIDLLQTQCSEELSLFGNCAKHISVNCVHD